MKNNKGKITDINSYREPKNVEDILLDQELRRDFILEGKRVERELDSKRELDGVGDAPALLNKMIDQLRESGKWDNEAYQKALREDAASKSENPEMEDSAVDEEVSSQQQEETNNTKEYEQQEVEKKEDIADIVDKTKYEFSVEELYKILPEEVLADLRRGQALRRIEEKWKKCGKKAARVATICIVVGGLFTLSMGTEANREHVLRVWTELTNRGQSVHIDKLEEGSNNKGEEYSAIEQIKEQLGIDVPQLIYKPDNMIYQDCEIDQNFRCAQMHYVYLDTQFLIYMSKGENDIAENIKIDGRIVETHWVYVEYILQNVEIEKLQDPEGKNVFRASFLYDNAYYNFIAKMDQIEFDKLIEKIIFN